MGVLARGRWATWPDGERATVRGFLHAWWAATIGARPARHDAESVPAAVALTEDDLAPYLAVWDAAPDPAATRHLADLVAANATRLLDGRPLGNTWPAGRPEQNGQVTAWLRAHLPAFALRLEAAAEPLVGRSSLLTSRCKRLQ